MRHRAGTPALVGTVIAMVFAIGVVIGRGGTVQHLNLPGRSDTRPYSHAVVAGDLVYLAGTTGVAPGTGKSPEDPMAEARLALDGMRAKLALAGASMDDLVMVQVFCSDLSLYESFNEVYATYFEEKFPVRAFIGSGPLLFGARFEVNGIAVKRQVKAVSEPRPQVP